MTPMSTARQQLANADKLWHLQQTALVSGLGWNDVRTVAQYCSDRIYSRDEVIYDWSEDADRVYIVSRGCVRIEVTGPGGKEKIISILRGGEVFGVSFLGPQHRHRTRAVAHQESWVLAVRQKDFLGLTESRPVLLFNLIRILDRSLSEARHDIEALSCLTARQRVADTLLRLGRRHGKRLLNDNRRVKLKIPLSHQQLAKLTGGNRPHVSTIMSSFRKNGLLSYQGRRLLLDTQRLAKVCPQRLRTNEG